MQKLLLAGVLVLVASSAAFFAEGNYHVLPDMLMFFNIELALGAKAPVAAAALVGVVLIVFGALTRNGSLVLAPIILGAPYVALLGPTFGMPKMVADSLNIWMLIVLFATIGSMMLMDGYSMYRIRKNRIFCAAWLVIALVGFNTASYFVLSGLLQEKMLILICAAMCLASGLVMVILSNTAISLRDTANFNRNQADKVPGLEAKVKTLAANRDEWKTSQERLVVQRDGLRTEKATLEGKLEERGEAIKRLEDELKAYRAPAPPALVQAA